MKMHPEEITPEDLYYSRRDFLKAAGFVGVSSLFMAACGMDQTNSEMTASPEVAIAPEGTAVLKDELGDPLTPYDDVTGINNFYEFTMDKGDVERLAKDFPTSPWKVEVGGLVSNPLSLSSDDLLEFTHEERIYRMRCVEGWSMVIPWNGFTLSQLLDLVQPTDEAQYVRFETTLDFETMPGLNRYPYPWPYVEGLRLDEARHPLTILATGVYGNSLPPQSGGPVRLVVPWKYGFKSIKSIIKIDLVADQPATFWSTIAPNEYGFYANVNPEVDHPRWSQATELRVGESERRPSLLFNGYSDEVASLYEGMNLRNNF
jgi:sulfoxide reductase catalytic subunit YedY